MKIYWKKRMISLLICCLLIVGAVPFVLLPTAADAENVDVHTEGETRMNYDSRSTDAESDVVASGACGAGVEYALVRTNTEEYNLLINGNGNMTGYKSAAEAPWYDYFESISDVTISDTVAAIPDGVFPDGAVYHVYLNSAAYTYAKAHNYTVQFDQFRVLCIGNSHTRDYFENLTNIIADLEKDGLQTDIQVTKAMIGSIGLYSGRNSNAQATDRSQLEALNHKAGAYDYLKNNRYDLVIVQDYIESVIDEPEVFQAGLTSFIRSVKDVITENGNGMPEFAWFADWVDPLSCGRTKSVYDQNGNSLELPMRQRSETYDQSLKNVKAIEDAIAQGTADMPNFVIHGSTFKQNAMSSYLSYPNALEQDSTHLTFELGRYMFSAAVMSEIVTHYGDLFQLGKCGTDVGAALTLENIPDLPDAIPQCTGSITKDTLDVIREVISSPNEFRQSAYKIDPIEGILKDISNMTWNFDNATDEESVRDSMLQQIKAVYGDIFNSLSVTINRYSSVDKFRAIVSVYYGYTQKEVTIEYRGSEGDTEPVVSPDTDPDPVTDPAPAPETHSEPDAETTIAPDETTVEKLSGCASSLAFTVGLILALCMIPFLFVRKRRNE